MDISKASNFERFIFDLLARNGAAVRKLFTEDLLQRGEFELAPEDFARLAEHGFVSGNSSHADRLATIRDVWENDGVMIDPHTADGLKVAHEYRDPAVAMIVLETALPAKFASTIVEATGRQPERPAATEGIEQLPKRCKVMPLDAAAVKAYLADNV